MPLDSQSTILAGAPYFDDFSTAEANNYHRVLFKPSVAIQARELTQLQTILQNQIERFGDNIYKRGTILSGCNIFYDPQYNYIKLGDTQTSGISIAVTEFANTLLESSDGLQALVVGTASGLVSTTPDLNTLYVKYINVGSRTLSNGATEDIKLFSANSIVTSYNRSRRVERIEVTQSGTLYSNNDTIVFAANNDSGSGAAATLTTYANGTIRTITMTSRGTNYLNPPTVSVVTSTGTGAVLSAINYVGQFQIANASYNSVGTGFAVLMDNGYAYQKGHFIRVDPQTLVVSKYSSHDDGQPNNVFIGFKTVESIANNTTDSTLNDNATGSTNEGAPGADRLKLTATLVKYTPDEAAADPNFLTLVEFQNGSPVRTNHDTSFNSIENLQARRTYEESGNYVIKSFNVFAEEKTDRVSGTTNTYTSNTTHLSAVVTPGIGYVNGVRTELFNNYRLPIRKSTDTESINNQQISTNFGNYVEISGVVANTDFNITSSANVILYSTAMNAMAAGATLGGIPAGSGSIGSARIRALEYQSGTIGSNSAVYRAYLYDINMNAGKAFSNVRAVGIASSLGADVVLVGNSTTQHAMLRDVTKDGLVFPTGATALKTISDTTLIYKTTNNSISFGADASNSTATITFSGNVSFPYTTGTSLSQAEKEEFIVIANTNTLAVNATGSVAVTSACSVVIGTSTTFTTSFRPGDVVMVINSSSGNVAYKRVVSIDNDTRMTMDSTFAAANGGNVAIFLPKSSPLNLSKDNAKINVNSANSITISLGYGLQTTMGAMVIHNAQVQEPSPRTKKIRKSLFVKISSSAVGSSPLGPWCLGIPDVHKITGVYVGSGGTYAATTTTNYVEQFELFNGQSDNLYGLSYLRRAPNATVSLSGANLLIKLDAYYDHGAVAGGSFYAGAASYPIDDVNREANTAGITTEEIELFTSPRTGMVYDLRSSLDFRPVVQNTADVSVSAQVVGGATIDPATTETLAVTPNYFPSPTKYVQSDLEYYLPRLDVVSLTSGRGIGQQSGTLIITEGIPSKRPAIPSTVPENSMMLATLSVPPYPSLDPINAKQANRSDLAVKADVAKQQKRYTMKDIGDIEKRIDRLEYYSLLNRLETASKDLAADRTLNGFFVESFNNFEMTNVGDAEYNAFVDVEAGELRPRVYAEDIDLKVVTAETTGVNLTAPDQLLLNYTTSSLLSQPFASRVRNTAAEFWRFRGQLFVYPKYDGQYDRDVAPTNVTIDLASAQQSVIDAVNQAFLKMDGKVTVTSTYNTGQSTTSTTSGNWRTTVTSWTEVRDGFIQKAQLTADPATTSLQGTFNTVSDTTFKPFMRSTPLVFFATGLRPNARHYVFFDEQDVNAHVMPGTYVGTTGELNSATVRPTGGFGAELRADSSGRVAGIFQIPGETFYVGARVLKILDVSSTDSENASVSFCSTEYNAYNINVDHQQVSISTRAVENINTNMLTTYTGVLSREAKQNVTQTFIPPPPAPPNDPLSQTFLLPQDIKNQTDGVYISHINIYFQSIGVDRGVTVQLREVVNGYPSASILPYASKWNPPSMMNVSEDGSIASTFTFNSPVFINTGKEYAVVVMAEGGSPDFYIFTGEAGQNDLADTDKIVKNDWGYGQLFTSVNATAWNPHSFEDLKFDLYRAKFSSTGQGSASLTHDDYEFMTLEDVSGTFIRGERVAQKAAAYKVGSLITSNNSFTVTGTQTAFTTDLAVGDTILISYGITPGTALTGTVGASTTAANLIGTSTTFGTDAIVGDTVLVNGNVRKIIDVSNTTNITLDAPVSNTVVANSFYEFGSVDFDILKVLSITNDTTITVDRVPKHTTNSSVYNSYMKVVGAEVDRYRDNEGVIYVKKSNAANDTFKFVKSSYDSLNANSGRMLVAGWSNAAANVVSIDNITVNYIESNIRTTTPTGTTVSAQFKLTTPGSTSLSVAPGTFMGVTDLPFIGEIRSRSNEIAGTSSTPSLKIVAEMQTATDWVSPSIDINPASIQAIRNIADDYKSVVQSCSFTTGTTTMTVADGTVLAVGMGVRGTGISNETVVTAISGNTLTVSKALGSGSVSRSAVLVEFVSNENTRYGISKNKYISKYMVLADGMEAEDFNLYLTAYKPVGAEIDVYARFINEHDNEEGSRKDWTLLQQSTNLNVFSDPNNNDDIKEYKYVVPKTAPFANLTGKANTDSTAVITGDTTAKFQVEVAVGDLIKIVKADSVGTAGAPVYGELDDYQVRTVNSISSNTSLTLDSAVSFTSSGVRLQKITQPRAAFLYTNTTPQYILSYHGMSANSTISAQYQGYKYVAIKVVLRASTTASTPSIKDVRALSVMV